MKNFYNLCQHKKDFGFEGKCISFATSHGKSHVTKLVQHLRELLPGQVYKAEIKSYNIITTNVNFVHQLLASQQ